MTADIIFKPVSKIFKLSLQHGIFPSSWKIADVVALHKKKSRSDPSNYRPISLLAILSKLLETVVCDKLKSFLDSRLHPHQFGFRPGRSTVDMLTQLSQRFVNALGSKHEVRAVALDISKAFDKVWHEGLLLKLEKCGISGKLLSWLTSYLSGRKQRVCINGSYSPFLPIKAGVPQGSVLGPILFLVFINDLFDRVSNNLDVFADDSTLWAVIPSQADRQSIADSLNRDLARIQEWAAEWLVTYNHTKTELVTFSKRHDMRSFRKNGLHKKDTEDGLHKKGDYRDDPTPCPHPPLHFYGKRIPERPNVKIVGLTLSDDLGWEPHIDKTILKARRAMYFLRRAKRVFSPHDLLVVYKSHIRSILEYACPIWMGADQSSLDKLDSIQRKAVKLIGEKLGATLQSLTHRRGVAGFAAMHRLVHKSAPSALHDLCPPLSSTSRRSPRRTPNNNSQSTTTDFLTAPDTVHKPKYWGVSFIPTFTNAWNNRLSPTLQLLADLQSFKAKVSSRMDLTILLYKPNKTKRARK